MLNAPELPKLPEEEPDDVPPADGDDDSADVPQGDGDNAQDDSEPVESGQ